MLSPRGQALGLVTFATVTLIIGNVAKLLPFRLLLVEFDARETTVAGELATERLFLLHNV